MEMPGFVAEHSLYKTDVCYRGIFMHNAPAAASNVLLAMKNYYYFRWGGRLCLGVEDDEIGLSYVAGCK